MYFDVTGDDYAEYNESEEKRKTLDTSHIWFYEEYQEEGMYGLKQGYPDYP